MKLQLADAILWYEVSGDGVPIVMVPGGPGFAHDYLRPFLDPLAADMTTVWVDLPGTGQSLIHDGGAPISHQRWIADLEELRVHLGWERWMIFGHSYGGWVAMEYALARPSSAAGLVLCSSAPSTAHLATMFERFPPELTPKDRELLEALLSFDLSDDEMVKSIGSVAQMFFRSKPSPEILSIFRLRPDTFRHVLTNCLPEMAIENRLGEVDAPTLVVAGDDDWQIPNEVTTGLAAGIPGAKAAMIPGVGHYPFVEDPLRFVEVVRKWLSGVKPS